MNRGFAALALLMAVAGPALAQQGPIRIGVLNDMSGPFADLSGKNSVVAAQMAAEDFAKEAGPGAPLVEIVSADHQNKADVGAAVVRKWVDCGWGDGRGGRAELGRCAGGEPGAAGEGPRVPGVQQCHQRSDGAAMCADDGAMGVRHLGVGQRDGAGAGGAGREDLVFHRGGLCVRSGFGAGRGGAGEAGRRDGAWRCEASAEHGRPFVLPAAGAVERGEGDRAGQCRDGHQQRGEAGGGVRHRAGRQADAGRAAGVHYRRGRDGVADRAGSAADGGVLLGSERRHAPPGPSGLPSGRAGGCRR